VRSSGHTFMPRSERNRFARLGNMLGPVYQSPPPEYLRRAKGKQGVAAAEAAEEAESKRIARNSGTDNGQWAVGSGQ
jgi:hypothetical protein